MIFKCFTNISFPLRHFSRTQIASRKREGHLNVMVKEFESHKKIEIELRLFANVTYSCFHL